MSDEGRLRVVLCWHMHQPCYQDPVTREYRQPWTYLHAIKDYSDMAAHLETQPGARAVVNFAPVLLEQLRDYGDQIRRCLGTGEGISDPLLDALASPVLPEDPDHRLRLIRACLRANQTRLIDRFPAYRELAALARNVLSHPEGLRYVTDQFLADLLVWYHLAWMGETVRRSEPTVQALQDKAHLFTLADRHRLLGLIGKVIDGLLPRYRQLHESGRVELSMTPYAHPIMPLLLDIASAREALPEAPLPHNAPYPGGEERVRWHIREGRRVFGELLGCEPVGCWPSEGAISTRTLEILAEEGFRWAASGESVLMNSLSRVGLQKDCCREDMLFRPWRLASAPDLQCFFRDDGLSDLIGFTYSSWNAEDAVANFVHHLENIAGALEDPERHVVSVILDGENAWEYYPENGHRFLQRLYERLASHSRLELTTFSEVLSNDATDSGTLETVVAGSWVYGTLSTWIGSPDKNRGWEMLIDAKQVFDRVREARRLDAGREAQAVHQLAICEGSDWFWWFGDYNPAESVRDFDHLYRLHLARLYQLLGEMPPEYLTRAFTFGTEEGGPEAGGVMRHGQPPEG